MIGRDIGGDLQSDNPGNSERAKIDEWKFKKRVKIG
jgi:hypothetical protein